MTDRDHFAAAALTGLLSDEANQYPTALQWEYLLKHAYRWADAMLRERERTGNQTAPPCVETDGPSPATAQPPASSDGSGEGRPLDDTRPDTKGEATGGRGHFLDSRNAKQEPVAWAAVTKNGRPMWLSYSRQDAEGAVVGMAEVIPLYRTPQTCPYVVGRTTLHCSLTPFTLTAEEREAIACAAESYADNDDDEECQRVAVTLGRLLERTK
jgi:hypothetical protein